MNHFYTIRLNRKKILLITAIVFAAAILIWTQTSSIMAIFTKDEPAALSKGNEDLEDVAVTFNISWGEEKVESILEVLENEDVQATFFLSAVNGLSVIQIYWKLFLKEHMKSACSAIVTKVI